MKQIQADCETKLSLDDQKGFGSGDLLGDFARGSTSFDPASVSGACNSGDPGRSAGSAVTGKGDIQKNYGDGRQVDWGDYSWGGAGKCDKGGCYKGLSEDDSNKQKTEAIKKADKAVEDSNDAQFQSEMDPDNAAKKAAAAKAKDTAKKAVEDAGKDPNKVEPPKKPPKNSTRPVGPGEAPCDQALQTAREILGECARTAWRSADCQSLIAKMKGCPDPALIYVDPDSGYACRSSIDPQAVKDAWVARCRELRRPVPGGPDPCLPPSVDRLSRFVTSGSPEDYCNNPAARIDPDSPECVGTLTIQEFAPNAQSLLVWGLNKLGGPIVVLSNPKSPDPAPGPPGPKPDPKP